MSRTLYSILFSVILLASVHPAAAQSDHDPFTFQFGQWRVQGMQSYPGAKWVPFDAIVRIFPAWQGAWPSVREEWWHVDSPLLDPPSLGSTERVWHPERRAWHMRFTGTTTPAFWPEFGVYERDGNQVVMREVALDDITGRHMQRLFITLDGDDAWSLNAQRSYDGGVNWFSWIIMEAERLPERPDGSAVVPASLADRATVETILADFTGSRGIAMDPAGNVIVGAQMHDESGNDGPDIVSVTPDGRVRFLASGLKPAGLGWSRGYVYAKAHDIPGGRLVRVSSDGVVEELSRVPGDGLAVDANGNAYTADQSPFILKTTPDGSVSVLAADPRLARRLGMTFDDSSGLLYATSWSGDIVSISSDGVVKDVVQMPVVSGSGAAWLAVADGVLYTTQFSGEQVFAYDVASGALRVLAGDGLPGATDGAAQKARFRGPNGIAASAAGDTLYVAELVDPKSGGYPDNRLRRIVVRPEPVHATSERVLESQKLTFISRWGDTNTDIYVMNANGGGKRRMTMNPGLDWMPRWSEALGALTYNSMVDGSLHLLRMNDWSGERRRVHVQGIPDPSWLPDGSGMVFVENGVMWRADAHGRNRTALTDAGSDASRPVVSPDGRMVAYVTEGDIAVISSDGGTPVRLTRTPEREKYVDWSPDSKRLVFTSERNGAEDVFIMDADGTAVVRLTDNDVYDGEVAWSPDGTLIAFHSTRDGNDDIYIMNTDGTAVQRLTMNPGYDGDPSWIPVYADPEWNRPINAE